MFLTLKNVRRSMAHELQPLPEEIPERPRFLRVDVADGEDPEPQEVCQPEGAPLVVDVL
jgi:hypothetical protein